MTLIYKPINKTVKFKRLKGKPMKIINKEKEDAIYVTRKVNSWMAKPYINVYMAINDLEETNFDLSVKNAEDFANLMLKEAQEARKEWKDHKFKERTCERARPENDDFERDFE